MLTLNDGREELYQWDIGRTATVSGECNEVHFSNVPYDYNETLTVEVKNGIVEIPNILLMSGEPLVCWTFVKDEKGAFTETKKIFNVKKRPKPSNYLYKETEVLSVKKALESALTEAKESGDFNGEKGKSAYEYALEGGFEGTEQDFAKYNARLDKAVESAENAVEEKGGVLFSNALKGEKSGDIVVLKDVSPFTHELSVNVASKNKINFGLTSDKVINSSGAKATYKTDNTIILNGTVTANASYSLVLDKPIKIEQGKTYTASIKNYDINKFYMNIRETNSLYYTLSNHTTFTAKTDSIIRIDVVAFANVAFNNYKIELQLEEGATHTDYAPYVADISAVKLKAYGKEEESVEYAINADGTVNGVKSIYPITTLLTDTNGAIISVEYNKDLNKAFEELYNAIISTGGNI